jgi:hypothetical protein
MEEAKARSKRRRLGDGWKELAWHMCQYLIIFSSLSMQGIGKINDVMDSMYWLLHDGNVYLISSIDCTLFYLEILKKIQ